MNRDRIPSFLGGGFDWSKIMAKIRSNQTTKSSSQESFQTKKPKIITSFLGYRSTKSKRNVSKVSSYEVVSGESHVLSSDQNQSTSAFVPPTLEN